MYGGIYYGPKARPWVSRSTPWAQTPPYEGETIALQTSMTPFKAGDFDPVGMAVNLPNPHYLHDWSGPNLSEWFSNITTELAGNVGNIRAGMALQSPYARGNHVAALQEGLISLGYSVGSQQADGIYGPATAQAVKNFQRSKGLPPSNDVDADTANALNRALTMKMGLAQLNQQQQNAGKPQGSPPPGPRIGLTGVGGGAMEWGQLALAALAVGVGLWAINKVI